MKYDTLTTFGFTEQQARTERLEQRALKPGDGQKLPVGGGVITDEDYKAFLRKYHSSESSKEIRVNDYHMDYASVSRTMLKLFRQSRVEFNLTYNTRELPPWEPTPPALLGTVLHAMLLEDVPLDDLVLWYPQDVLNVRGGLIGSRASDFREANPGRVYMKEQDYDGIESAVKSVLSRPDIGAMLNAATHKENRFDAEVFGLPCRCKPDIFADMGDYLAVYDLKFSKNVDPDSWRRTSKRLALWLQDAFYSRLLQAKFGKPVQFRFCNIETKAPYRVQWYWYVAASREMAFDEHKRLMFDLKHCYETGVWEDGWASECILEPWDFNSELTDEVEIAE